MNKIINYALGLALAFSVASCVDGEDYQTITRNYNQCFSYITSVSDPLGEGTLKDKTGLHAEFRVDFSNESNSIAELTLYGVPVGEDRYADCSLSDIKYEVTAQRTWKIQASGVKASNADVVFDNIFLEVIDRTINGGSYPIYNCSYTVNGKYRVTLYSKEYRYFGTTSMTPLPESVMPLEPYSTTSTGYQLLFSEDLKTADLYLYNAQFASNMPKPIDMISPGLEVSFTNDRFTVSGENVIPTAGDVPFPAFKILTFVGHGNNAGNFNATFTVNALGTVTSKLTPYQNQQ